jgi:hypothetical protein
VVLSIESSGSQVLSIESSVSVVLSIEILLRGFLKLIDYLCSEKILSLLCSHLTNATDSLQTTTSARLQAWETLKIKAGKATSFVLSYINTRQTKVKNSNKETYTSTVTF